MVHRCIICDRTNNRQLVIHSEQFFGGPYFADPLNENDELCQECQDAISEDMYWDEEETEVVL